jgi:cellulose synthase operon protein YhjQ
MDSQLIGNSEEALAETPEDVAILYSWANLHGAKYRDFSASRREYRAQVRHRAAEAMRRAELDAKAQAEQAAADAERVAREAERAARSADQTDSQAERDHALRAAEEAARRASAERVEAARRAEAAAMAEAMARREEREIAEAHASAERQAKSYGQSEMRRRYLAGPQPASIGLTSDPYGDVHRADPPVEHRFHQPLVPRQEDLAEEARYREDAMRMQMLPSQQGSGERRGYRPELEVRRRPQGYRPDEVSGIRPAYRPPGNEQAVRARISNQAPDFGREPAGYGERYPQAGYGQAGYGQAGYGQASQPDMYASGYADLRGVDSRGADSRGMGRGYAPHEEQPGPAWLYAANPAPQPAVPVPPAPRVPEADTLQHQRERVASQWFALKGAFEPGQEAGFIPSPQAPEPRQDVRTPLLAVFSLAGGVGKTSLVATLGRALSALGEKVLLADTTSHGLLPYYFGASELRPGVVRTFSPPSGSTDAPIHLVSYDVDRGLSEAAGQDAVIGQMAGSATGTHRVVLDLNASSGWMVRRLAGMNPTVLVPVAPDMNSVISLQTMERYFEGMADANGHPVLPYYVLNQFDAALPLHLDVREVLRRQLGDRLLPIAIRRAPAVSEALAEGMTVVDYAPDTAIAEDYRNLAGWLRNLSPPATQGFRNIRWSER